MLSRWETVFLNTLICISAPFQVSSQSNSINFTDDRPPKNQRVQLGNDVSLSWGFSYSDPAKIINGPWNAPGVQEITFGTWKYIDNEIFLDKKIVTVDNSGSFKPRSGYGSKMDWSYSVSKLTFKLKGFAVQDQAIYGINIEFGLTQRPLEDSVTVTIGVSYIGQDENTTVRNETGYISETADLFFQRSAYDQNNDFKEYRIIKFTIIKGKVYVIALKKEQDGKAESKCFPDSVLLDPCQERYSLRYINNTHVSFRMSNVTQQDSGRYLCEAYSGVVNHDPEQEEVNFIVQEKPTHETSTPGHSEKPSTTPTQVHETSAPKAKGGHSDIQLSVTLLSMLMIFQALFQ